MSLYTKAADLSGATLSGADLTSADISEANLFGATLERSTLDGADLTGADLTNANLFDASLKNAILKWTVLTSAKLESANFTGADFSDVDLSNTVLKKATLKGAELRGAHATFGNGVETVLALTLDFRHVLQTANPACFVSRLLALYLPFWNKGAWFDENDVVGARFSSNATHPWHILRRSYTGPSLFFILLATFLAFLPLICNAIFWNTVNRVELAGLPVLIESIQDIATKTRALSDSEPVIASFVDQFDEFKEAR